MESKKKATVGLALTAIMVLSVIATAISIVSSSPEVGTVEIDKGPNQPVGNIGNKTTDEPQGLLQITLTVPPDSEDVRLNNVTIKQVGTVPQECIKRLMLYADVGNLPGEVDSEDKLLGFNETVILNNTNITVSVETNETDAKITAGESKNFLICANYTGFELGKTFKVKLWDFNATGVYSGNLLPEDHKIWITGPPIVGPERRGTGTITISRGANDVVDGNYVNAGENTTGIVIMQVNFTAEVEDSLLKNITIQWNGTANGTDIDAIYLVNDTNSSGVWDAGEPIATEIGNFSSSDTVVLEFKGTQIVPADTNRSFLIVVNTTKFFWSNETLAVNITSFNATNTTGTYLVSTAFSEKPLRSNRTIGQAIIKVEYADKQPIYIKNKFAYIPNNEELVNVESMVVKFVAIAGTVNISSIVLQPNSSMALDDQNNTWPTLWLDKDADGEIDSDDIPLNTSKLLNLSNVTYPYGVNLSFQNVTIEANETTGENGTAYIIIAFNTTKALPVGNVTKIEINYTGGRYNYTAYDVLAKKSISDTSDFFDANSLQAGSTVAGPNVLLVERGSNTPAGAIETGERTIPVLQINITNNNQAVEPRSVKIHGITVAENGSADEKDIEEVLVIEDSNANGRWDAGESKLAGVEYTKDDSNVTLPLDLSMTAGSTKTLLIIVNTTASFQLLDNLTFYIWNPSICINATAPNSEWYVVTNRSEDPIVGNTLTASGTVSASLGAKSPTGRFSMSMNMTLLPLMQVNFTAGVAEPINITNITLTWNGTAPNSSIKKITIVNDSNANGVFDFYDGTHEQVLNESDVTWVNNKTLIEFDYPLNISNASVGTILILVDTNCSVIEEGETIAINISNPSTDYNATGKASGLIIHDKNTDAISSYALTAKVTATLSVNAEAIPNDHLPKGKHEDVVLMRLNFSKEGEPVNITSIRIKAGGAINETNNVTGVALKVDGQVVSPRQDLKNDGYLELKPSTPITVTTPKTIDIIGNISANLNPGDKVVIFLENPARDIEAEGTYSKTKVQNETITPLYSPQNVTITGSVNVAQGVNITGPVVAGAQNNTVILQLNFSAKYEDVNITAINLTWEGTFNCSPNNITIGVVNDTNANGKFDNGDHILNGSATFNTTTKVASINLTPTNLTVPANGSAYMVIYLNVSGNFSAGDTLKVSLLNPAENCTAIGNVSGKPVTVEGDGIESETLTGTGYVVVQDTGNVSAKDILAGKNDSIVVWQFNITAKLENVTIEAITLYENGTATPTDFESVYLVNDTDMNGAWNKTNEHIITDMKVPSADNGTVTLNLTTPMSLNENETVCYLVVVNTTENFIDGETLAFNITNATVKAKGEDSDTYVCNNFTTQSSNVTRGYGSIDLYAGDTQPDIVQSKTGNVSVMELNFSAIRGAIDIMNITVRWIGNASIDKLLNISIWKDADGDGIFSESEDTLINMTAFKENITIETNIVGGNIRNLTVDGATNNVYIVVKITDGLTAGKTLGFAVNQTLGVGYNATCNKTRLTPYATMNATAPGAEITQSISVKEVGALQLKTGWNLVSVPKELSDDYDTAGELFDLQEGGGELVFYYNASTKTYKRILPNDTIELGKGYWVYKKTEYSVTPEFKTYGPEEQPPIVEIPLEAGWNLIGHLDTKPVNVSAALGSLIDNGYAKYSKILWWNTSTSPRKWDVCYVDYQGEPKPDADFTRLEPYKGYFIYMRESGTYA